MDMIVRVTSRLTLSALGYRNVYELAPLIEIGQSQLEFEAAAAEIEGHAAIPAKIKARESIN